MAEAHGGTAAAGDVGFPAVEDGDGRGGFFAVTVFFFLSFSLMHKQFQLLEWGGRRMGLEMTNLLNERWVWTWKPTFRFLYRNRRDQYSQIYYYYYFYK